MGAVQRKKIVYPISMLDYFKGAGMLVIILYHCRKYSPAIPETTCQELFRILVKKFTPGR